MARVLVADDEAEVRDVLKEVLERAGYEVALARDGNEALQQVRSTGADAVVCDIWMPDVDGLAFLKQVKAESPQARIVIISGGGPGQSLELSTTLAETYGADSVLIKPFRNERLLAAVAAALAPS